MNDSARIPARCPPRRVGRDVCGGTAAESQQQAGDVSQIDIEDRHAALDPVTWAPAAANLSADAAQHVRARGG